jgi:DNA-binding protein HU-beta
MEGGKMTKAELITTVAKLVGRDLSKRTVESVVDAMFKQLKKGLKKDKRFSFPGFGTFSVRKRAARKGRNPRTNEVIRIPSYRTVVFTPSKSFKQKL